MLIESTLTQPITLNMVTHGGGSIMQWASLSSSGTGRMHRINGMMDGAGCRERKIVRGFIIVEWGKRSSCSRTTTTIIELEQPWNVLNNVYFKAKNKWAKKKVSRYAELGEKYPKTLANDCNIFSWSITDSISHYGMSYPSTLNIFKWHLKTHYLSLGFDQPWYGLDMVWFCVNCIYFMLFNVFLW